MDMSEHEEVQHRPRTDTAWNACAVHMQAHHMRAGECSISICGLHFLTHGATYIHMHVSSIDIGANDIGLIQST